MLLIPKVNQLQIYIQWLLSERIIQITLLVHIILFKQADKHTRRDMITRFSVKNDTI